MLGGGYVGLEMAQAYRRFGSRVTVIECGPRIISWEDPDVADEIQQILGGEDIEFPAAAEILAVQAARSFTHASVDDFRIIRDNLAGGNRGTGNRLVRCCMFTDALLAHVGLSESEPQREGITARVAKLPMSAILRTEATDEKQASRSS